MKKLLYRLAASLIITTGLAFSALAQNQPRDADSNAMIYNGAYTKAGLTQKLTHGDGHHSAKTLQQEYSSHGISINQIKSSDMVNGYVTKSGDVVALVKNPSTGKIENRVVATEARSYGRTDMPGSQRSGDLFIRPTSVSFQESQLPAFVYMPNNRFQYAIIKSCGNITVATPKAIPMAKAVIPKPAPVHQKVKVVQKVVIAQPSPTPSAAPAPVALPETGTAIGGLAGASGLLVVAIYYRQSRYRLKHAQLSV